jgi:hypothetical protein
VAFNRDAKVRVFLHGLDRFVEDARRFRPQRVAVEVEVHVFERDLPLRAGAMTCTVTVSVAVMPLPSSTVIVSGTAPTWPGAVHGVWRSLALPNDPVGLVQR